MTAEPIHLVRETSSASDNGRAPASQARELVQLAEERFRFGKDPGGDLFAVPRSGPPIVRMLRGAGSSLRAELAACYADDRRDAVPSQAALAAALQVLEGRAQHAERQTLALRSAQRDGEVVIDLGDETGRAVMVRPDGWAIVDRPPVLFRRTALTAPLPEPVGGGDLAELRTFVHIADEAWPLAVGWLVTALLPNFPAPILYFRGAHGAGKSSGARMLSRLIDPSPAQLHGPPREQTSWTMTASSSRVVALDNLSRLPEWLGDALCRAVTGEGRADRKLYSDADLVVFNFKRALVLTAIDIEGVRGDLADRLLPIELERIDERERRTEDDLERAFAAAHPRMFGALLDLLARVLERLPSTRPDRLPRLADAGRVFAALDEVAGTNAFASFCGIADRLAYEVVEGDAVAEAIRTLMEGRDDPWEGTTADLLEAIAPTERPQGWPKTPQALTGRLTRIEDPLRRIGLRLARGTVGKGSKKRRRLTISADVEMGRNPTSDSSDSSQTAQPSHSRSDEGGGRGSDVRLARSDETDEGRTWSNTPSSDPLQAEAMRNSAFGSDEADEVPRLFSREDQVATISSSCAVARDVDPDAEFDRLEAKFPELFASHGEAQ